MSIPLTVQKRRPPQQNLQTYRLRNAGSRSACNRRPHRQIPRPFIDLSPLLLDYL